MEVHWLVYKGTIYLKMAYVPLGHNYRVVNFVKVASIREEVSMCGNTVHWKIIAYLYFYI